MQLEQRRLLRLGGDAALLLPQFQNVAPQIAPALDVDESRARSWLRPRFGERRLRGFMRKVEVFPFDVLALGAFGVSRDQKTACLQQLPRGTPQAQIVVLPFEKVVAVFVEDFDLIDRMAFVVMIETQLVALLIEARAFSNACCGLDASISVMAYSASV